MSIVRKKERYSFKKELGRPYPSHLEVLQDDGVVVPYKLDEVELAQRKIALQRRAAETRESSATARRRRVEEANGRAKE